MAEAEKRAKERKRSFYDRNTISQSYKPKTASGKQTKVEGFYDKNTHLPAEEKNKTAKVDLSKKRQTNYYGEMRKFGN